MKDYTEYDFAAIIGAKVSILLKSKIEYGGTLILVDKKNGAIFLLMNDNPLALEGRWFAIEDIVPGSLTAKIKVEDMSVKQLIRMMDEYKYKSPKLDENGIWFECSNGDKAVARFGKDIDCTDWGWEHE